MNFINKKIYITPYNDIAIQLKNFINIPSIKFIDKNKSNEHNILLPKNVKDNKNNIILIISPNYFKEIHKELTYLQNTKILFVSIYNGEYKYFKNQYYYNFYTKITQQLKSISNYYPYSNIITKEYKKLLQYKNKHKNDRVFLIGNGPSLNLNDLEKLNNEYTFAANKIFLAFNEVKWRPTYYIVEDFLVMEQNYHIIKNLKLNKKILPRYFLDKYHSIEHTNYFPLYQKKIYEKQKFSSNMLPTLYAGATVIYTMIQIAIYMGFKEIYLIGLDFHFEIPNKISDNKIILDEGKQNHFHKNYRDKNEKWFAPNMERQREAFKMAYKYATANNIKIYNASRKTKLDVFERIDFDDLFNS